MRISYFGENLYKLFLDDNNMTKAIIFLSTEDLIEQLACSISAVMELHRDIDDDSEYLKGIYNQSMEEIKKYHTDYPYLVKTKKFACYII